ncbi:hypothetical protein AVEN_156152-1 [Araneus ventricosus]|uniref:Uncharacterized protein n=1 Tax=Araneus ventricosus TaxID=182803 RepID=A0A4Y2TF59_ARAVE|nr:hypothetical protein AVEN_156152-1 [Araneus ventricosus]
MENLRNRMKVDIVQTKKRDEKLVASPAFHVLTIFDENLVAVQRKLTKLYLNRPIQSDIEQVDNSSVLPLGNVERKHLLILLPEHIDAQIVQRFDDGNFTGLDRSWDIFPNGVPAPWMHSGTLSQDGVQRN